MESMELYPYRCAFDGAPPPGRLIPLWEVPAALPPPPPPVVSVLCGKSLPPSLPPWLPKSSVGSPPLPPDHVEPPIGCAMGHIRCTRLFRYQYVGVGYVKCSRYWSIPTRAPDFNPFVFWWNVALRIDYCGLQPFSSTLTNLMILIYLLTVLICIIH